MTRIATVGLPASPALPDTAEVERVSLAGLGSGVARPLSVEELDQSLERLRVALEEAGPFDAVLLFLSGETRIEGQEDSDGLLLAQARSCLAPGVLLAAAFDPARGLSPLVVRSADLVAAGPEKALALLPPTLAGEIQPVMALSMGRSSLDPPQLEKLDAWIEDLEREPGILHVAIAAGPGSLEHSRGAGVLVVADGDAELAAEVAEHVSSELWSGQ